MVDDDWWDTDVDVPQTPASAPRPVADPVVPIPVRAAVKAELAETGVLQHDLDPGPGDPSAINNMVPGIDLDRVDPHPRVRRAVNDHRPYR